MLQMEAFLEFPKISIKMKNSKTFRVTQTANRLKEIIQSPIKKVSFDPETKIFLRKYAGIYRHFLSKCFENVVLERLEMVQCKKKFLRPTRNIFTGKFFK